MNIIPLDPTNIHHTHIVLSFVVQSTLDYGDLDADARLLTWQNCEGTWAAAVSDSGNAVGIVCVVSLCDTSDDALFWLEILPQYQNQGVGNILLTWAQAQAQRPLHIQSVPSAVGFYQQAGMQVAVA